MSTARTRIVKIVLGIAATLSVASALGLMVQTITLGTDDYYGGTLRLGNVDPTAIGSNTVIIGTIRNKDSLPITDLDFKLKNTNHSGAVRIGSDTNSTSFDANGHAHYDFSNNKQIAPQGTETYEITGISPDSSGSDVLFDVTPSVTQTVSGNATHCGVIRDYEFDELANQKRDGVSQTYHAHVVAVVVNGDSSKLIDSVTGTASALDVSRTLVAVHPKDENGNDLTSAVVAISGSDFTVSGFTPLGQNKKIILVIEFSASLDGTRMRADIQAHYQI